MGTAATGPYSLVGGWEVGNGAAMSNEKSEPTPTENTISEEELAQIAGGTGLPLHEIEKSIGVNIDAAVSPDGSRVVVITDPPKGPQVLIRFPGAQ